MEKVLDLLKGYRVSLYRGKLMVIGTFFLALVLAVSTMSAPQRRAATLSAAVGTPVSPGEVVVEAGRAARAGAAADLSRATGEEKAHAADLSRQDVLWLARVIYSETNRPEEQELVAWTVRNRVETGYRGKDTYKEVALDPWQFSAFNRNSPKRSYFMGLSERSQASGWQTALGIAENVAAAPAKERPFTVQTRHFYSERSMVGRKAPAWAQNRAPVRLDRPVDPRRFRFYAGIS